MFIDAVIGAGFSGTMACVHRLRLRAQQHARSGTARIVWIERSGSFPAGVAYSTSCARHLLNVPAGQMSAFVDDPEHFVRWAKRVDPSVSGASFVRRELYGRYLASLLEEEEGRARGAVELVRVPRGAAAIRRGPGGSLGEVEIDVDGGERLFAGHAILALGNFPPARLSAFASLHSDERRYVNDPWSVDALSVEPEADVLLVGTGLTMFDMVLALEERGHRGAVHAVSRRGLIPQSHRLHGKAPARRAPPDDLSVWPRTARGVLRSLREEIRQAEPHGTDWREVLTSLRDETPALWQSLPAKERDRFLRHLRPFWETHRHRAAPEVGAFIAERIAEGKLTIHAAHVVDARVAGDGVSVRMRHRREDRESERRVARVINCTGPETDLRRVDDRFVQRLLADGIVRPDAMGLGLDTDPSGDVIDAMNRTSPFLSLLGPLRKGGLWENTAVPELRREAARYARDASNRDGLR